MQTPYIKKQIGGNLLLYPNVRAPMQRKVFWITFILLGLMADIALPLIWGIIATVPIFIVSWWVAYKSDWFE